MGHGADFQITDPKLAYLGPAKAMAMTAVDLLWVMRQLPGISCPTRSPA